MKCPVCKTECGEQSVCLECGFGQLTPEFLNHADTEYWIQNVVWPHREQYWERINSIFHIENRKLLSVDLEHWMQKHRRAKEIVLSVPYGVEAIERNCFRRFIPIDGPYKKLPPLRTVYVPKTVSAIDTLAFDSGAQIDMDPGNPYYYVCDTHLIDKRTSALVTGPHPICISKLPTDIKRLSSWSCSFLDSKETYLRLPSTINKIDSKALSVYNPDCCIHIPRTVSIIEKDGLGINWRSDNKLISTDKYIFCDHDARPDAWDEEWVIQHETSSYTDSNINIYICWHGTWHYENGKPMPNNKCCGELVSKKYLF